MEHLHIYEVIGGPIRHKGKRYLKGEEITLEAHAPGTLALIPDHIRKIREYYVAPSSEESHESDKTTEERPTDLNKFTKADLMGLADKIGIEYPQDIQRSPLMKLVYDYYDEIDEQDEV